MLILKYLQLPFYFEKELLQEEVSHLANNDWQMHYQTRHYEGEWSAIPLRSGGGKTDNIIISPTNDRPYLDTIFLKNSPYLKKVLQTFKCPLQAVRLLKLKAGAVIKEHRDADLYFEKGEIRLHIPVITHDEVEFYLDKERIYLKEGECWYMNFNLLHSISNKSRADRIHLVVDALVNDWVKELFSQPAACKKEIEKPGYDEDTRRQIIARLREMNTETGNRLADEMETSPKLKPGGRD
jgi:Aspartyl/Asparaginyl beta-hydroxylase